MMQRINLLFFTIIFYFTFNLRNLDLIFRAIQIFY